MKHKNFSYAKYGYLFCLPFVLMFLTFSLYPLIFTTSIAFTDRAGPNVAGREYNILTTTVIDEAGNEIEETDLFGNFRLLLNNRGFRNSFGNTLIIWSINFAPQVLLALLLAAWFTNRRTSIKGQGFFKVIFYMPNIITAATIALLFRAMFLFPKGVVNDTMIQWGLMEAPKNFEVDPWASRLIIAFIQFWMWYGYTMLIFISGIMGINPEMYESADIDGANAFQQFFYITLPNLRTIMVYTLITSLIGGLNMFDIPRLYSLGGPDAKTQTSSLFIYGQAFEGTYRYNVASAASIMIFIIIACLSVIIFYLMRDKDAAKLKKIQKEYKKAQKLAQKAGDK
ncbi:MAG: sugar ABC transporter permease [Lachnospiraceae bacterium]|nr:sugar ABC transporter permease [Lachnospiraceae bacterium]